MSRAQAPMRAVLTTRLGPRSQRLTLPDGGVAIVCGRPPRIDTLECGHEVISWGNPARRRRCEQCGTQTEHLELEQ